MQAAVPTATETLAVVSPVPPYQRSEGQLSRLYLYLHFCFIKAAILELQTAVQLVGNDLFWVGCSWTAIGMLPSSKGKQPLNYVGF